jgi:hypothetical protein
VRLSFIHITILLLLLCSGCTHSYRPSDYVKWVEQEENGLRVKRVMSDFEFILQYKPVNYMIAQEKKSNSISREYAAQRTQQLANSIHFNFIIRSADDQTPVLKNQAGPDDYFARISHFLNEGQNDFRLRSGSDTFDCTFCHLEQNYGLAPENTVVLAFEPRRATTGPLFTDNLFLMYEDKVFGTGTIKMKIEKKHLDRLPEMKLDGT